MIKELTPSLRPGIIFSEHNNECTVVDLIDFRKLKVNPASIDILKLCDGRHGIDSILNRLRNISSLTFDELKKSTYDFISTLIEKDILLEKSAETKNLTHTPPGVVFLEVTKKCNLKCIWCYNDSHISLTNELNTSQWKKVIDQLSENECTLLFTGGEALTRKDIFQLSRYAKEKGLKTQLFTNGTLVTTQNAQEIFDTFDYVRITIDGATASTHDYIRGKGEFDRAINGMELLINKGVRVCWQTIVSKHNIHELLLIPEKAIKMGAVGLRMSSVDLIGRGVNVEKLQLSHAQEFVFWSFISWAMEKYKSEIQIDWGADYCLEGDWEDTMSITPGEAPSATPEGRRNPNFYMKFIKNSQCGVGSRSFLINSEGFIGLCPLLAPPEVNLGNVLKDNVMDIWYHDEIFLNFRGVTLEDYDECRSCGFRYRCLGGCRGRAYNFTKSLKGCDKKMLKYFNIPKEETSVL
jgi:radical SAM protein with 4Fe4S-binding SPASM domain